MQHLPIWFISQVPHDAVDLALSDLRKLPVQEATMGVDGDTKDTNHRSTDIRFAESNFWFGDLLRGIANQANQACSWGYEVNAHENVQFAEYSNSQHYSWHTDTFPLSGKPVDRKITAVCLLNDPTEFEGGEFHMRLYSEYTAPLTKGSVIAFPSILEHRVTPVLSGTRCSATIWLSGPRFK